MSLGFSYMSFVIKQEIEDTENKTNHFDIESYNYIFNRGSAFLDSEFVSTDHEILEEVLKECWKTDPDVIDSLAYVQSIV